MSRSHVFIAPNTGTTNASPASATQHASATMPPPLPSKPSTSGDVKLPPGSPQQRGGSLGSTSEDFEYTGGNKKSQKRAANRLSAQLSRKRKKQFMEELKDENDDLKRKEQILKSIPDLIVVFDSTGKLWFVSESVSRFLQFSATELEGSSIWERLCEDSVRLLKAAFMDSLAAREADSDTAPLGSGFWELRLVDRDGNYKVVTLNGVVHFAGERPECVCSIRPSEGSHHDSLHATASKQGDVRHDSHHNSLIRIKPHQSVVSSGSGSSDSSSSRRKPKRANLHAQDRGSMRISNSENSSESNSETASGNGSSDE
jgi:PAS domain S-box-containing protein